MKERMQVIPTEDDGVQIRRNFMHLSHLQKDDAADRIPYDETQSITDAIDALAARTAVLEEMVLW